MTIQYISQAENEYLLSDIEKGFFEPRTAFLTNLKAKLFSHTSEFIESTYSSR